MLNNQLAFANHSSIPRFKKKSIKYRWTMFFFFVGFVHCFWELNMQFLLGGKKKKKKLSKVNHILINHVSKEADPFKYVVVKFLSY